MHAHMNELQRMQREKMNQHVKMNIIQVKNEWHEFFGVHSMKIKGVLLH
jgi:hypothetical protein